MSQAKDSAGLLMYRIKSEPEVLLVHPGGPFFKNKDEGVWSIPKGETDHGEEGPALFDVAKREFEEETSIKPEGNFTYLTAVKRSNGSDVHVWVFEGDCDPAHIKSNTIFIDWPPRSGKKMEIPEIDRGAFFTISEAKKKVSKYQLGILQAFESFLTTK